MIQIPDISFRFAQNNSKRFCSFKNGVRYYKKDYFCKSSISFLNKICFCRSFENFLEKHNKREYLNQFSSRLAHFIFALCSIIFLDHCDLKTTIIFRFLMVFTKFRAVNQGNISNSRPPLLAPALDFLAEKIWILAPKDDLAMLGPREAGLGGLGGSLGCLWSQSQFCVSRILFHWYYVTCDSFIQNLVISLPNSSKNSFTHQPATGVQALSVLSKDIFAVHIYSTILFSVA